MRSLLITILSILSLGYFGQMTMNARHFTASYDTAQSVLVYIDDFNSYANSSDLDGQGNWIASVGTHTCNGTGIYPNSTGTIITPFNAPVTLSNDQYAQLTMNGNSSRSLGQIVRGNLTNGGNGYVYYITGTSSVFAKIIDGVITPVGGNSSAGYTNVTLRIEAVGSIISCYLNDVLDSGLTNTVDGTFNDADFTTGFTGVMGNNNSGILVGDNFETGNK